MDESRSRPVAYTNHAYHERNDVEHHHEVAGNSSKSEKANPKEATVYKVYKKRWFMLLIVCILNISNAMLWICYAPISNFTNDFYNSTGAADLLSLVFMIVAIPVGFLAMWSVDSYGLRTGIWLGTWVNVIGAALRVVSSISSLPIEARFPLVLTGQIIASVAQPFIMYLPTKLAAQWFPENHRAIANTLGSMSNPLGIMTAMIASPYIVYDKDQLPHQMLLLNGYLFIPAAITTVLVCIGVWTAVPPTPPSGSADHVADSFWLGLKKALKNKTFMVLVLTLGGGMGLFNAAYTLLQQILCPKGYSNSFSGICGALLIGGGIIGSIISGVVVDITKKFEEIAKVCFTFAAVAVCAFAVLSLHSEQSILIATLCTLFGAFGFSIYPLGLEMGVECTYPVAEATSAGLIIISGQIQGIIFVLLMSGVASPASQSDMNIQTCSLSSGDSDVSVLNWQVPNIIFCGLASLLASIFVLLFWPKFKRMEAEQKMKSQEKHPLKETSPATTPSFPSANLASSHIDNDAGSSVTVITIN